MVRTRSMGVLALLAVALFGVFATRGNAQEPPPITLPVLSTTTTTPPPPPPPGGDPSTTTPPSDPGAPGAPGAPASPPADPSGDGDSSAADGSTPTGGGAGQIVPGDAQAAIDALVRSGA